MNPGDTAGKSPKKPSGQARAQRGIQIGSLVAAFIYHKNRPPDISFVSEDGYTVTYTLEEVQRDDYLDQQNPEKKFKMILAWEENHEPYDISKDSPIRLVNGQTEPEDVNKPR